MCQPLLQHIMVFIVRMLQHYHFRHVHEPFLLYVFNVFPLSHTANPVLSYPDYFWAWFNLPPNSTLTRSSSVHILVAHRSPHAMLWQMTKTRS
jgi:hypothetical protein